MQKVFILQAVHFHLSGRPMTAYASKEAAAVDAAEHVNDLLEWIELPRDATPETWEADVQRARKARAEQMGCDDPDDLGEDDGDVWLTELTVAGADGPTSIAPPAVAGAPASRLHAAQIAVTHIKAARRELRRAGARNAADYSQRALKSAEGAVRHAQRLVGDAQRANAA